MSVPSHLCLIVSGIIFCSLISAACVSTTIGDVTYSEGGLSLSCTHEGGPSEGYVQVTVYEVRDNQQEERDVLYAPFALQQGENTAIIPTTLEPGEYKLYIYLIQNNERKAAAIRDIVVN